MVRDLYFVLPSVSPGDSLAWSELSDTPYIRRYESKNGNWRDGHHYVTYEGVRFTPIPYCTFGDYDNSSAVERSNARVMLERFPWLVTVTGDYGSQMVGYLGRTKNQNPELLEAIEKLEAYMILDESDESELEMTMEREAWCDWGRHDFAKDLQSVLDEIDPEWEHEIDTPPYGSGTDTKSELDAIWHKGCDAYNVNGGSGYVIEGGGNVHFYIDEWCEAATRAEDYRYPWSDYARGARREMRDLLVEFSKTARVSNGKALEAAP